MLKLTCPHCQSQFTFAAVPPGTPVRCRTCKQSFSTPESTSGVTVTPENIFGPAAGRAANPAPAPAPIPAPAPTPITTFKSAPPATPTPLPKPAPVPEAAPVFAAPAPEPIRKPAPEPEPVAAEIKLERPLPKSVRGPLEAETAHVCPKCGLTSVKVRGGGPPSWTSHALGLAALAILHFVMPGTVGLAVGIAVWALAFIVLNVLFRTTPGFKCTTCAHTWE